MAIHTDDSFKQFLPATQKVAEIQIRPVAQVEGGIPDLRGVQSMAQVAADVSRETEALGKTLQAQERERQFSSAVADFGIKSLEAELQASTLPYKESVPFLVEQLEKSRSDLAGQITDTKAKEAFSQHAQQNAVPTISKMTWSSKKREIEDNANTVHVNLEKTFLAFNAANPNSTLKDGTYIIDKAVKNGLIAAEDALVLTEGLKDKIDEMGIQDIINKIYKKQIYPDEAIGIINDKNNFVNIDPVIRSKAIQEITATAEHMRNVAITKKEHDQDRAHALMERDRDENTNTLTSRMFNSLKGTSTESINTIELDTLAWLQKKRISASQAHFLLNLVKSAKEGPTEDDPIAYAREMDLIQCGKADPMSIAYDPGLKTETRITLINKAYEVNNSKIGEKQANSLDRIESFIRVKGVMESLSPDQEINLAAAHDMFDDLITSQKKTGKIDFRAAEEQVILQYGNPSNIAMDPNNFVIINGMKIRPTLDIIELGKLSLKIQQMTDQKEKVRAAYWLRRLEYFSYKQNDFNNIEKPKVEHKER